MTDTIERRAFTVRQTAADSRTFTGVAVPWDTPADIGGYYTERFERGAVQPPASGKVLLYDRHNEPIGLLTEWRDTDSGWEIEAKISKTSRGDDVYTYLRDGVMDQLSIGFIPIESRTDDQTGDVTRTAVEVREVSVVPFGAYGTDAPVTDVRERTPDTHTTTTEHERAAMADTETINRAEAADLRASIEDLARTVETLGEHRDETPAVDTRSAGEILRAIVVDRDEATTKRVNDAMQRAYAGGTTADAVVKDAWIGDLTRIYDGSTGALANLFGTAPLPATGLNIEFGQLASNSVAFTEQVNEGDTIASGKVALTTETAKVHTYAGSATLSVQEIERSNTAILDANLRALTMAAAVREKAVLRTAYAAAVAAQAGAAITAGALADLTAGDWSDVVVDAAVAFEAQALPVSALVVATDVFKALGHLEDGAGRPVFDRTGQGSNTAGTLSLPGLSGNLSGVRVVADSGAASGSAAFVNTGAIRRYLSPLVSLQDQAILTLSRDFAAYRYGAVAVEIPGAIVPVAFGE